MNTVVELYRAFKNEFPQQTRLADARHLRLWGTPDDNFAYVWFESLANALNQCMRESLSPADMRPIFGFFSNAAGLTNPEIYDCVDTSFTENLFREVPATSAAPYRCILPANLQALYLRFHNKAPC